MHALIACRPSQPTTLATLTATINSVVAGHWRERGQRLQPLGLDSAGALGRHTAVLQPSDLHDNSPIVFCPNFIDAGMVGLGQAWSQPFPVPSSQQGVPLHLLSCTAPVLEQPRKTGGVGTLRYPLLSDITKSISQSYGKSTSLSSSACRL